MRGIIDEGEGINTVFLDLVGHYQGEQLPVGSQKHSGTANNGHTIEIMIARDACCAWAATSIRRHCYASSRRRRLSDGPVSDAYREQRRSEGLATGHTDGRCINSGSHRTRQAPPAIRSRRASYR
jgi:hypothetical protein